VVGGCFRHRVYVRPAPPPLRPPPRRAAGEWCTSLRASKSRLRSRSCRRRAPSRSRSRQGRGGAFPRHRGHDTSPPPLGRFFPAPRRRLRARSCSPPLTPASLPPEQVSLEDLERCVASIGRPVAGGARAAAALWSRHSDECLAAAGAAGLLYGGPFAYSVLFVRAFTGVGWAAVRGVLSRLREAYRRAKELPPRETEARAARAAALRSELRSLASECEATERFLSLSAHRGGRAAPRSARTTAAEARRAALLGRMRDVRCELDALPPSRRAAPVLAAAAAHDPLALRDLCLALCAAAGASLSAATSSAARALSLGESVGERISGLGACASREAKVSLPCRRSGGATSRESVASSHPPLPTRRAAREPGAAPPPHVGRVGRVRRAGHCRAGRRRACPHLRLRPD